MPANITPCLWFDDQAEEAANFYTSVFPNSKITAIARYGEAGTEIHGRTPGSVMTVVFELNGNTYTALNGGPTFQFNEAISLQIHCENQEELDYYWQRLGEGGDPNAQVCGWLKDRFGLSWQVVPKILSELMGGSDKQRRDRVFAAMLQMKKIEIAGLQRAYAGEA